MDINSINLKDEKLTKLFKRVRLIKYSVYILAGLLSVSIVLFGYDKFLAITSSLFIITIVLMVENFINEIRDIALFKEIHSITQISEDTLDIFEHIHKEYAGRSEILGKDRENIMKHLDKVSEYIYDSKMKEKSNKNMTNELILSVAKSLKDPVNEITENIEELDMNLDYETINNLEEKSNLLKHNIEELFELTKAVNNDIDLEIESLDIKNILKQAIVEYEDKFKEHNLVVKNSMVDEKLYINCDGQKMWRVFEILLDNIVKYSKENSRVHVKLYQVNDEVIIKLINTSKEELNIDTKDFIESLSNGNKKQMGIFIACSLIELQKGKVDIVIDGDMFKVEIKFKNIETDKE